MDLGIYKIVKNKNQHTKWYHQVFDFLKIGVIIAVIALVSYFTGLLHGAETVAQADKQTTLEEKVNEMQIELINEIAKRENTNNIPIVIDDNKSQTLAKKDKVSIGCIQMKISTIQLFYSQLGKGKISDMDAVLLALDCEKAKAFARESIFKIQGALWHWSVATKEMGTKVELIREMMK